MEQNKQQTTPLNVFPIRYYRNQGFLNTEDYTIS